MGVWIETLACHFALRKQLSHPAWVCGLKHYYEPKNFAVPVSHPAWVCGLKQRQKRMDGVQDLVTPCVGVWIETGNSSVIGLSLAGHTLRGCVD